MGSLDFNPPKLAARVVLVVGVGIACQPPSECWHTATCPPPDAEVEPGGTSETTEELSETTSGTEETETTETLTETTSTADAEATGDMSSLEGGLSEPGPDAGDGSVPEAGVADGGDAGQSSTDLTDTAPLACVDNFDCNPPRPVCFDSRCIACIDDETDYCCFTAAAPRCKSGPTKVY